MLQQAYLCLLRRCISGRHLTEGGEKGIRRCIVSEGPADVSISIYVAGAEDETPTELERVSAQSMLAVSPGDSVSAGFCIIVAE